MIKLSVIIPTFNRRRILERTLKALSAQDLPAEDYEAIVVLDGSTDDTAEMLRGWKPKFAFRFLEEAHRGPSSARNAGIRAARGHLVLFLDDDLIGVPDLLRQHCTAHADFEPRVVHGPIYIAPGSPETVKRYSSEDCYNSYYGSLNSEMELRYPEPFAPSIAVLSSVANSSMPREVVLRCGGFDEQILAVEDLELSLRLWKMGVPFRFRPTAIVHEYYGKSSWEYLTRQAALFAEGNIHTCRKHPEYRPHSLLSFYAEKPAPKKWLNRAFIQLPVSLAPLLALPLLFEKQFCRFRFMRGVGARLLRGAEKIAQLRSSANTAGSWNALQDEFGRCCPALVYHYVGPSPPGNYHDWAISPEEFERQIRWLTRHGYVGIRPSDWLRWLREGTSLPQKPILLTFDDAYADTAEFALPILRRYGFSAAVFVVTGRLGGTNTWDQAEGCESLKLMTAEQICYWAEQGMEFGAHSRTHAHLTKLSAAECSAEVAVSKSDLSALLGSPITSFAYPYGEYDEAVYNIVRSEFDLAFTMEEGVNYLRSDPHLLQRAYIRPKSSIISFALCVRWGGLDKFRKKYGRFGIRTRLSKVAQIAIRFGRMIAGRQRRRLTQHEGDIVTGKN